MHLPGHTPGQPLVAELLVRALNGSCWDRFQQTLAAWLVMDKILEGQIN